ncbi:MATE family efflux transporter [Cobetia amphilecti]|uniref:Oligosaccharide flippase family protein n=1 Tax=Cobetia amphilecti TaxID=1055104 RepID=A0ABT6USQ9_9GAMM|nr:MATE family efflux transporter [Cobetia amphilecti]MDI5885745.1 oligosaccharide flippase family protein [Cobetia amphilecti]
MYNKIVLGLKDEIGYSLFITFLARGLAAIGGLILIIVIGRLYGASGVGVFAIAQSICIGASLLARGGMDSALIRFVGQNYTSEAIKKYLFWSLTRATILSVAVATMVFVLRFQFASWFNAPALADIITGIAFTIPPFTIAFIISGFMKGIRKPAIACLLENGIVMLIATAIVLVMDAFYERGINNIGWALAISAWFVFFNALWITNSWFRNTKLTHDLQPVTKMDFRESSISFFIMSLAQFIQQVVCIMVAAWLLNSVELGIFRSAERAAFLISFVLLVINSVFPPRFANLYYKNELSKLSSLARKGAVLGITLASPLLFLCLIAPHWVLGIFGEEFVEAANLLRILALAQMVNVATGSVGFILNMTGHDKLMRNISLSCNILGLALFFTLISIFGVLGAALALAFILVLQNCIALVYVWKKLKIWVLPTPNFIKWF